MKVLFKVRTDSVRRSNDDILYGSVGCEWKLAKVQAGWHAVFDLPENQLLRVVLQNGWGSFRLDSRDSFVNDGVFDKNYTAVKKDPIKSDYSETHHLNRTFPRVKSLESWCRYFHKFCMYLRWLWL